MNTEMIRKIDAVLERVKEPESGLSIAQLGLVAKLRYNPTKKKLYFHKHHKAQPKAMLYCYPRASYIRYPKLPHQGIPERVS